MRLSFKVWFIYGLYFAVFLGSCVSHRSWFDCVVSRFFGNEKTPIEIPDSCGRSIQKRIVGGTEAFPYSWTWMVSFISIFGHHFCAGVLITRRHILTAAHCLRLYKYAPLFLRVLIGSNNLEFAQTFYVASITTHPSFGQKAPFASDVAIVTLAEDLKFVQDSNVVCLPQQKLNATHGSRIYEENFVILGWGYEEERGKGVWNLREATVEVLPDEECSSYEELYLQDVMFCAGGGSGGRDACKGDSGGPLLWQNKSGNWIVVGIISFGKGCARPKFPGVYTDVYQFNDWIKETVYLN